MADFSNVNTVDITKGIGLASVSAYNAGFRGNDLVVAVAIAGAESAYNPNMVGDVALEDAKWGPSIGFWQIRSLKNPSVWAAPDNLRIEAQLYSPAFNANAAYQICTNNGTHAPNFQPWSTFTNYAYNAFMLHSIDTCRLLGYIPY